MNATDTMTSRVEGYVAYRRRLGFELRIEGRQLLSFAHYADQVGHQGPVTIDLAVSWATLSKKAQPTSWARRLEVIRPFARYCALFDANTEVPPPRLLGPGHRRLPPHIYSEQEIRALLRAASELRPIEGLRPKTYYTLLGLLACTGLRVSEALALKRVHVDLKVPQLAIVQTKFRKSRIVPLHPSAVLPLARYAEDRDRTHSRLVSASFFLSEKGAPLVYSTVRSTFMQLRKSLGWTPSASGRLPRIQDLRHSFACRRLLRWYEHDVDVDREMLSLSTYLGHAKVTDTYWYLTGVPDLMALCAHRFERFAGQQEGALR